MMDEMSDDDEVEVIPLEGCTSKIWKFFWFSCKRWIICGERQKEV